MGSYESKLDCCIESASSSLICRLIVQEKLRKIREVREEMVRVNEFNFQPLLNIEPM